MKRKIVEIDESRCNGCGVCIPKCVEGALQIVEGKARLVKDAYCDGLGACLGKCPQDAITVIEREAEAFDQNQADQHQKTSEKPQAPQPQKTQWPIKIDLVPPKAPFFENAVLLLTADCAPVAYKSFHDFAAGKRVIIGCPKFNDARAYAEKLTEIFKSNNPAGVEVLHMEVPCCTGLKWAVNRAIEASGKKIVVREFEVKVGGEVVEL
jgi:Pyruvate/2-oxoacid:ferredoxin oxidoreductase delta subunit